jgi:hypothetical protein
MKRQGVLVMDNLNRMESGATKRLIRQLTALHRLRPPYMKHGSYEYG